MNELNTYYIPTRSGNSCLCYLKSDADKFISDLEERHKKEVGQLLMEISKLKKLVEIADKLLKQKGGFMIKDVTFKDVKLEGFKKEGV